MDRIQVCYIEPHAQTATSVTAALEATDPTVEVHHVETASEAQKLLETSPVDCVVTEWELPDGSEAALIKTLRGAAPTVPIVCFTDQPADIAQELFAITATDYLQRSCGGDCW